MTKILFGFKDVDPAFADKLPPDDKMRLQKNPLRILDS